MELKITFAKYLKTPKKGLQTVSESLIKLLGEKIFFGKNI